MAPRMRPSTLKKMLAEEGFGELLELARFDALGSNSHLGFYHFCRKALATMTTEEIRPPRLIGGNDLIAMGFRPGPDFKRILAEVEDLHLDGALASRDDALRYVADHYQPQSL
jgi:poly(A) polymerase